MKRFIFILFFSICYQNLFGQNFYLKITSEKENELKTIDSIGYKTKHLSVKSLLDEKNLFTKQLTQFGFYDFRELENKKENDSVFSFKFSIGKQTKSIHIYIGKNLAAGNWNLYTVKNDTLKLPFGESEAFLNYAIKIISNKNLTINSKG